MSKDKDVSEAVGAILGCIIGLILLPFIIVGGPILQGWVVTKMWDWFVIAQFQVGSLTLPVAIGLVLIVGLVTRKSSSTPIKEQYQNKKAGAINNLFQAFVSPLIVLLFGWVIHTYFM